MRHDLIRLNHAEELQLLHIVRGLVAAVTPEEVEGAVINGLERLIPFEAAGFCAGETTTFKLHWGAAHNDNGWMGEYPQWEAEDFLKLAFVRDLTPRALRISDLGPLSNYLTSPLYNEYGRKYGFDFTLSCAGKIDTEQWSGLSIMRGSADDFSARERDLLTLLTRPYVASVGRALELQGVEREIEALLTKLGEQGLGALLVDDRGRVLYADPRGREVLFRLQGDGRSDGVSLPRTLHSAWQAWRDGLRDVGGWRRQGMVGSPLSLDALDMSVDFTLLEADGFGLCEPLTLVRLRPVKARIPTAWRARLSPRELEVIQEVLAGHSNKAIGERLFISEWTVRRHLTTIFGKLGLRGRKVLLVAARGGGHGGDAPQP